MKKLLIILFIIAFYSCDNEYYLNRALIGLTAGIDKDSVMVVVNNNFEELAALIDTSFVDSLDYLEADYTSSQFRSYINSNFERLSRYTYDSYNEINWYNYGSQIRNIFNGNCNKFLISATIYNQAYCDETRYILARFVNPPVDIYRDAIDDLVEELKDDTVWVNLELLQIYAAHDAQGSLIEWKNNINPSISNDDRMKFFANKGYMQSIYPDDLGGYVETNYNPSDATIATLNNRCVGIYNFDPIPEPTASISSNDAIAGLAMATSWYNPGIWVYPRYRADMSQAPAVFDGNKNTIHNKGMWVMNRNSVTNTQHYHNGVELFHRTNNTSVGVPDDDYEIFSASHSFRGRISMFFESAALTPTQVVKFYNAFQTYINTINENNFTDVYETDTLITIMDTVFNDDYFYTIDIKGDTVLSMKTDTVMLSFDNGETYPYRHYFADWDECEFGKIFSNGNILLSKLNGLYYSDDNLTSINVSVLHHGKCRSAPLTDAVYDYHVPVKARYPGAYFRTLVQPAEQIIDGNNMLVWGNYTNLFNGASPVNIYYTLNGKDVKTAVEFGEGRCDDGTADGSNVGVPLGNPECDSIYEHVHSVNYNPNDVSWYVCMDAGLGNPSSHAIIKLTYDFDTDIWTSEYKALGVNARLFNILFTSGSDTALCSSDLGNPQIFKLHVNDFNDIGGKQRYIYQSPVGDYCGTIFRDAKDCYLGIGLYHPFIYYSSDGNNWATVDMQEQLYSHYGRLLPVDNNGYFRARPQLERSFYSRDIKIKIK